MFKSTKHEVTEMGFLLGAYSKQMAGKRVRSLQARMVHVQSQLRRATRDIEQREKFWAQVQKNMKNSMSYQMQNMSYGMQVAMQGSVWESVTLPNGIDKNKLMMHDAEEWAKLNKMEGGQGIVASINRQLSEASGLNSQMIQNMQASYQQTLALHEQEIEMAKEAELQPLKDLEDTLQTEKDSLESQIQLAQADYEACKEMEKAGVKALTPNYTGQS